MRRDFYEAPLLDAMLVLGRMPRWGARRDRVQKDRFFDESGMTLLLGPPAGFLQRLWIWPHRRCSL